MLDAEEQEDHVVGAGDEQHAADAQQHEREELGGLGAEVQRAVARRAAVAGPGHQDEDDADGGRQEADVVRERGDAERAERIGGGGERRVAQQFDDERRHQRAQRQHRRDASRGGLRRDAEQEQRARDRDQDQLGRDEAEEVHGQ
jgi:hypothetical protein